MKSDGGKMSTSKINALSFLIIVVAILGLTGCSGGSGGNNDPSPLSGQSPDNKNQGSESQVGVPNSETDQNVGTSDSQEGPTKEQIIGVIDALANLVDVGEHAGQLENGESCVITVSRNTTPQQQEFAVKLAVPSRMRGSQVTTYLNFKVNLEPDHQLVSVGNEPADRVSVSTASMIPTGDWQITNFQIDLKEDGSPNWVWIYEQPVGQTALSAAKCFFTGNN
jgi:hypothetical protein